jgi:hypothetical protein
MLLDFVIIGAEKSGTTLLVKLLQKSERILIPDREVRHFRDPFFPDRERPEEFIVGDDTRLKGIKHPSYLGRPEVPARLKEHNALAKLIAVLRDPALRLISAYLHYTRLGQIPLLHPNDGLKSVILNPDAEPKYRDMVQFSAYSASFSRWLQFFSRQQMLVLEYEELVSSAKCATRMFEFLGVPAPSGLWPFEKINAGEYDWGAIKHAFRQSRRRLIYDDTRNIIGSRELDEAPDEFESEPLQLSEEARRFVREYFSSEARQLADLGILIPKFWQI